MFSAFMKPASFRSIFTRRPLNTTSVARTEGAVSGTKGFSDKERAAEGQWARQHDDELLKKLKKSLADQEQSTKELQQKVSELENKHK